VLALPLIEASHFLASLVGAALLLVAFGLQRRLDAVWHVAVLLLAAGAVFSLAKGWDFEEAALLALAAAVLLPARSRFHRRSSLLAEPFSAPWTAAAAIVLAAAAWLARFSHQHAIELAHQSWWGFALHAEAARSLRATVAAVVAIALLALYRLVRAQRPAVAVAQADAIERARPLVEHSPRTYAHLALRGDKALLFSDRGDAFVMFARRGRSWVAMGDPVGSESGARELRWRFRDLSDRYDGWCVFFEVSAERRGDYAEIGLGLTPLGEQARVELSSFGLEGPMRSALRQSHAKLQRRGAAFAIVPRGSVAPLVPALEQVSRAWLEGKAVQEKGFSNASFDARYVEQCPLAVVRFEGEIVAFANLWLGADAEELSVDLMRHRPDAPNGTMDFLFSELMLWGRAQGYRWFDLGMAPLAGLYAHAESRLWSRVGTLLYEHGEHFYNFDGLRRYKAKFDPQWRPMYLASPGGVALPAILVDVTALIAGGLRGIVAKPRAHARGDA
jgi:phosphatidylglycerol lysyltransferase